MYVLPLDCVNFGDGITGVRCFATVGAADVPLRVQGSRSSIAGGVAPVS